ncbi:MAG: tetratricopeptide repeat protein [Chloroflexota bacterium]|nr:tetratricopeptide repeat protein [Chloroflexota bacterium]
MKICEGTLGEAHPDTAGSVSWLAFIAHQQHHYEQARPLYERALAIYEHVLGQDHPTTKEAYTLYVVLLHTMGREEEARRVEDGS